MTFRMMIGAALCGVSALSLLKALKSEVAPLISALLCLMLFGSAASVLSPVIEYLRSIGEASDAGDLFGVLFRSVGLALITQVSADVCRDAGEASIGRMVELCGKSVILLLTLPMVKTVFGLLSEVLGG